ncbi:MAG TPA: regulatory protein RecX [Spirochaetota bacterium]|nr:regulatory protein RecX [Spirochaetota bacterium]
MRNRQWNVGRLMIEITGIQFRENHALVALSTGESLLLPHEGVKIYALATGKVIDHDEYGRLKEESDRFSCYRRALYYLSLRSRSVFELERYLNGKGFSKDGVREAVARLLERGYLDDYAYAMDHVRRKRGRRAVGKNRLLSELFRKGVPGDIAKRAIAEYGAELVDQDELYRLAAEKFERLKGGKDSVRKLVFFLRQRGFESDEIRRVVGRLSGEDTMPA